MGHPADVRVRLAHEREPSRSFVFGVDLSVKRTRSTQSGGCGCVVAAYEDRGSRNDNEHARQTGGRGALANIRSGDGKRNLGVRARPFVRTRMVTESVNRERMK